MKPQSRRNYNYDLKILGERGTMRIRQKFTGFCSDCENCNAFSHALFKDGSFLPRDYYCVHTHTNWRSNGACNNINGCSDAITIFCSRTRKWQLLHFVSRIVWRDKYVPCDYCHHCRLFNKFLFSLCNANFHWRLNGSNEPCAQLKLQHHIRTIVNSHSSLWTVYLFVDFNIEFSSGCTGSKNNRLLCVSGKQILIKSGHRWEWIIF